MAPRREEDNKPLSNSSRNSTKTEKSNNSNTSSSSKKNKSSSSSSSSKKNKNSNSSSTTTNTNTSTSSSSSKSKQQKQKRPSSERIQSQQQSSSTVSSSPKPKRPSSERIMQDDKSPKISNKSRKGGGSKRRTSSSLNQPKKGVHFKKTVGVNTIPNLDSYTSIETMAYWYTVDEYAMMEDECDQTAAILDSDEKPQQLSIELCSRGLEAWTIDGEQKKEWNVQEAIDRVWQAQLEQWRSAKDHSECWEFIRKQYLPSSQRCCRDARTLGMKDEENVQDYLRSIRKIYKSRCSYLGKSQLQRQQQLRHQYSNNDDTMTSASTISSLRRSTSEYLPKSKSSPSREKALVGRNNSEIVLTPKSKSSTSESNSSSSTSILQQRFKQQTSINEQEEFKSNLKASSIYDEKESESSTTTTTKPKRTSKKISRIKKDNKKKNASTKDSPSVSAMSYASTVESSLASNRRIVFRPRSKTKIPTSPVRSVCEGSIMDESTTSRRMRSHMSVCSDDSTRRRMLRSTAAGIRQPKK